MRLPSNKSCLLGPLYLRDPSPISQNFSAATDHYLIAIPKLRIPTIVTAHTDERDRCSVRASVVFRV